MMDNILKVMMSNGSELEINVIDIIEGNYNNINKKYIVYSVSGNEDIFISILNETDSSFSLDNIDDDNEYRYVENLLLVINEGDLDE